MFEFLAEYKESFDNLTQVKEAIKELESLAVLVGIPQENSSRPKEETLTNAELLYIHTNGSPVRKIPARPVIEPAIEDDSTAISDILREASEKALEGNKEGMMGSFKKAGMRGQNAAREWFTNPKNGWSELKKDAIAARERKMKKGKLAEMKKRTDPNDPTYDPSFVMHRPLIDTGEMRKSITYVVREK